MHLSREVLEMIVEYSRWSSAIGLLAGTDRECYGLVNQANRCPGGPFVKSGSWRPGIIPTKPVTQYGWCHGEATSDEIRIIARAMRSAPERGYLQIVAHEPSKLARLVKLARMITGLKAMSLTAIHPTPGSELPTALSGFPLSRLKLKVSRHGTVDQWTSTFASMQLDALELCPAVEDLDRGRVSRYCDAFPVASAPDTLRELVVSEASGQSTAIAEFIRRAPRLRRLDLEFRCESCYDDDDHSAWLITQQLPKGLERLCIHRGRFLPRIASRLEQTLCVLKLTGQPRSNDPPGLYHAISQLRLLRVLDLSSTGVGMRERDAHELGGALTKLVSLEHLMLRANGLGNAHTDMQELFRHPPEPLQTIDLCENHLFAADLDILRDCLSGRGVISLDISGNGLGLPPQMASVEASIIELRRIVQTVRMQN
jgi:hypothetical protein